MSAVGRHCDEDAFAVKAPEAKQNVTYSLAQRLASRNVFGDFHVRAQNELVYCINRRVGEQHAQIAIDWNYSLVNHCSVGTDLVPYFSKESISLSRFSCMLSPGATFCLHTRKAECRTA